MSSEPFGPATPHVDRLPTPAESARSAKNASETGMRVLIVDDHPEVANTLTRLLRLLGYDVRAELNPIDALAAARSFRPAIALLDIGLPVMDGYALARELRQQLGDSAPVLIALSGYNHPLDQRHSREAGFAAHLTKPIDADDLVTALDQWAPADNRTRDAG